MKHASGLLSLLAFAVAVTAHGGIIDYTVDGKLYNGFKAYNTPEGQSSIQRVWNNFDPIQDVTLPIVACNGDGVANPGQLTAPIEAGKSITAHWNDWPHPTGPVLAYMAKCPGSTCDDAKPNDVSWFKVAEVGLISGSIKSGVWGASEMASNNNSWTFTIPRGVSDGNYLVRVETIALHSMPAQVYPECMQVTVTGGAGVEPSADQLVKFPGAYAQSDPGIMIDLYGPSADTTTTYVIPGPPLYTGDGSSGSGSEPVPTTSTESEGPIETWLTGVPAPDPAPTMSTDSADPMETWLTGVPSPEPTHEPLPIPPVCENRFSATRRAKSRNLWRRRVGLL